MYIDLIAFFCYFSCHVANREKTCKVKNKNSNRVLCGTVKRINSQRHVHHTKRKCKWDTNLQTDCCHVDCTVPISIIPCSMWEDVFLSDPLNRLYPRRSKPKIEINVMNEIRKSGKQRKVAQKADDNFFLEF